MLNKRKIVSVVVACALVAQSSVVGFAFGGQDSHMGQRLNAKISKSYGDFTNTIQSMIQSYDDQENYLDSITMQIDSTQMVVNGVSETIDTEGTAAKIYDGSTMIPARALAETLGCEVGWDAESRTVEITSDEKEVNIPVDQMHIEIDGELQSIPAAARIENGRTLVPARALCEALGCEVGWDANTRTVTIKRDFQTKRLIVKARNKSFDFAQYGAIDAVLDPNGEYAIVQFATESGAIEAYNQMQNDSNILSVEPDVVMLNNELNAVNNVSDTWDTDYTNIVNFANTINGNKTMKFAVVDSGVNAVGLLTERVAGGVNCIGTTGTKDNLGHGTMVANVIAKSMGNVPFEIVPVKITDTSSFAMTTSIFGSAIGGCTENGVDVINMSISIGNSRDREYSNFIKDSIKSALDRKIAVVVAAGNDGLDIATTKGLLASREDIIVVGASNKDNQKAWFSAYGTTVDLMAPGENVMSIDKEGNETYTDGTSFSSPHVAAAAALIKAKNPSWKPAQIESELKRNVKTPDGWNTAMFGEGILYFNVPGVETQKKINASNITVQENATAQITVYDNTGARVNASDCTYTVGKGSVATVSSTGVVTGKTAGETKVTIKTKGSDALTTEITVTVTAANAERTVTGYEWNLNENFINLSKGGTYQLAVFKVYSDNTKDDITSSVGLMSDNSGVATVSANGTVKAVGAGEATITYSSLAAAISMPRPILVTVTDTAGAPTPTPTPTSVVTPTPTPTIRPVITPAPEPQITGYEWSTNTSTRLEEGETTTIKLFAVYSDGHKDDVTKNSNLYSSDTAVVKIDNKGKITAMGAGSAFIMPGQASVSAVGSARPFSIVVTAAEQAVELIGYEWSKDSIDDMEVGDTVTIKLYTKYSDGSENDVTQSSRLYSTDESVVTIDSNGKIKAVGGGTATIMVGQAALAANVSAARPISITVNEPAPVDDPSFVYDSYNGGVMLTKYDGSDRYVTIPDTLGGEPVVAIGDSAFKGNKNISSVSMPASVEEIGSYAFANCKSLKTVHFSRSITEIGAHAFDDCTSLTGVTLPSRLSEIASFTFRGCTGLKKITIPNSVSYIGESAFANCRSLNITIPASVTDIASTAFTSGNSIKIKGTAGSAAEIYATDKGFNFN